MNQTKKPTKSINSTVKYIDANTGLHAYNNIK